MSNNTAQHVTEMQYLDSMFDVVDSECTDEETHIVDTHIVETHAVDTKGKLEKKTESVEQLIVEQSIVEQGIDEQITVEATTLDASEETTDDNDVDSVNAQATVDQAIPIVINENQYQLISVVGMKFAVQLLEVNQAVGDADVLIENGLLEYNNKSFSIVDVAALIKPGDEKVKCDYYLLINERQIALACQDVLLTETIEEEMVCWRTNDSKRKWLAGIIKEKGIAMLDLSILEQMQFSD